MNLLGIIFIIMAAIKNNYKIFGMIRRVDNFSKLRLFKEVISNVEMINIHLENRCQNKYLTKVRYNFNHRSNVAMGVNKKRNRTIKPRTTKFDKPVHQKIRKTMIPIIQNKFKGNYSLSPNSMLDVIFYYLEKGGNLSTLSDIFQVSISVIHNIKTKIFPLMMEALSGAIKPWTNNISKPSLYAIDCTCHPIVRCHPGQREMYRSDKGCHFISSQLIVDINTQMIVDVVIGKGRNNDPGLAIKSGTNDIVVGNNLKVLADSAYRSKYYITPRSHSYTDGSKKSISHFKKEHAALRSIVERTFKHVKDLAACAIKQKNKPYFHGCVVMTGYYYVNIKLSLKKEGESF
ncbi:hypothetical protein ACTA71_008454 [Dictyostelium dimigraforme]